MKNLQKRRIKARKSQISSDFNKDVFNFLHHL